MKITNKTPKKPKKQSMTELEKMIYRNMYKGGKKK